MITGKQDECMYVIEVCVQYALLYVTKPALHTFTLLQVTTPTNDLSLTWLHNKRIALYILYRPIQIRAESRLPYEI